MLLLISSSLARPADSKSLARLFIVAPRRAERLVSYLDEIRRREKAQRLIYISLRA